MSDRNNVPEGSPAERWSLSLVEPLVSTTLRQQLDTAMVDAVATSPTWGSAWFGGVLSDIVATLPDNDSWRTLSATIEVRSGTDLHRGPNPPGETGALLNGKPFGAYTDAADLSEAVFEDPTIDIATVALVEPLEPLGGAMLAFASDGWSDSIDAALAAWKYVAPRPEDLMQLDDDGRNAVTRSSARDYFTVGSRALRWAVHRRKSYGLLDDPWPIESAWAWAVRARKIARGEPWATNDLELAIATERIAAETIEF